MTTKADADFKIVLRNDGQDLLECVGIRAKLYNQDDVKLNPVHTNTTTGTDRRGNYETCEYAFASPDRKVSATVRTKAYKNSILVYVKSSIANEREFARTDSFAPENCIVLHVTMPGSIKGLMANYQHKDWWTRPAFDCDAAKLPPRVQSLLWQTEDDGNHYLLPVVDRSTRATLEGKGDYLAIQLTPNTGGLDHFDSLVFCVQSGEQPFDLPRMAVERILEQLQYPTLPREKKRYPGILEYLGWCTWDAFYQHVDEKGIVQKAEEFKQKELPVKWIMIDDGWSETKDNRLLSLRSDPAKFPNGLLHTVETLKQQYGVKWVGVWHTFFGYWAGVHPESKLAQEMKPFLYQTDSGKLIPYPDAAKGFGFWNAWHTYLKQEGIDFVKVDGQAGISNFLRHHEPIGEAARGAHQALEASVGIHFDQCIINCMGMAAENMWNRPISAVSRNSDDFVPSGEISFKEHALQNAYNSFYHGELYWGDWDMFWTGHEESVQNSVLRAVSGGPVYFSDRVGATNPDVIWPLIFNDGKIMRGDRPGLPTLDCLFHNPNEESIPLKVWNTIDHTGVIAAFNINLKSQTVAGSVSPSDVQGIEGSQFLVYDCFQNSGTVLQRNENITFTLSPGEASIYSVIPVESGFAAVGLANKYLSYAGIVKTMKTSYGAAVHMKEGGRFAFYASAENRVKGVRVNERELQVINNKGCFTVDTSTFEGEHVIEIVVTE